MLDFYLIKDDQPKPNYPEQVSLEFVIGLDSKTFESLIKKRLIDSRFDYYSDFRWNLKVIEQINLNIVKAKNLDSDIDKLNLIINKALELKSGIIAYCD
ncbi:hypothetical protein LNJ05_12615 [Tenacibaculum finnmarkense genomovar ulcerans]|uniref:hypothetical protein n=1 Tax=Tenacibaculum finnmarkense TaxID=2781243 RepID=UPI001E4C9BB2|nr:hypothetical protein [Tenacibaculum finnmarkense]MCD8433606.1 hypothetical protein [Tenacibaculum finnmarkense genomovar ulcerans]